MGVKMLITVICDGWGILHKENNLLQYLLIEKLNFLIAIAGVSSPNCGDKVEVQFLFMAYSLGVRVHPPLYILNNVVELVY